MARELSSTSETAAANGVCPETIRRLHRDNKIVGYQFGRILRFDIDEVRAALRTGNNNTSAGRVEPDFGAV